MYLRLFFYVNIFKFYFYEILFNLNFLITLTTLKKIPGAATALITLQLKLDQWRIVKIESNVFSLKPVLFWFSYPTCKHI